MNNIIKHRAFVASQITQMSGRTASQSLTKAEDVAVEHLEAEAVVRNHFEKARSGKYADTAQNRKLNRVGQEYGSKQSDDQKNRDPKKDGSKNVDLQEKLFNIAEKVYDIVDFKELGDYNKIQSALKQLGVSTDPLIVGLIMSKIKEVVENNLSNEDSDMMDQSKEDQDGDSNDLEEALRDALNQFDFDSLADKYVDSNIDRMPDIEDYIDEWKDQGIDVDFISDKKALRKDLIQWLKNYEG